MLQEVLEKTREGYKIKEICINNDIFSGKEIESMSIHHDIESGSYSPYCVCIELIYKEILYAQVNQVNWVILEEE